MSKIGARSFHWRCAILLVALTLWLATPLDATWSIIAVDRRTGQIGIAAASCTNNVQGIGSIVPGVGVVVVQAMSNNDARIRATELLRSGVTPDQIIQAIRAEEFDPENQQYGVVLLASGHTPRTYTGSLVSDWKGSSVGEDVAVQGNVLVSKEVVAAALSAFEVGSSKTLAERLIDALAAGAEAGGDRRCGEQRATSAYLTIYNSDDSDGAPYVHLAVYGIERGQQPAVTVLQNTFDQWHRERSGQRSTRLYFIP